MSRPALTPAQQDYLEAVLRLSLQQEGTAPVRGSAVTLSAGSDDSGPGGVRVTDIASELACRLPTVVRSLARLRELGLIEQEERGRVHLSARGRALAGQLLHRHEDVVHLLSAVLGVPGKQAEAEACLIEHGLSAETAQRLHEFLERWEEQPRGLRTALAGREHRLRPLQFTLVGGASGAGRRK